MSDVALKAAEVGRIKDLLFGEERRVLTQVQQLVSRHEERIGTDDRLQQSVSQIIALALRDAQITQHEQLAAAISPLVMAGVKREILNSRHDLIDALHPMMGHMMSAYVTNGLRDFLHQTDRRLESGLSPRRWRLRFKSAITGVPVNELILRERKLLKVEDILLLKRGSGALIDRWQANPDSEPAKGAQNPALLSSMLSAITEFARDAFSDGKSELRTLDIGSARIFLRASPAYLVGIKCVGQMSAAAEKKIDRAVLRAFEDYSDALSSDVREGSAVRRVLPALADRLAEVLAPDMADDSMRTGRLRYVMTLGAILALMGFATAGRQIAKSFEAAAKQREIETVISHAEAFNGLPVAVRPDSSGRGFLVSGVAPSQDAAIALNNAIQDVAGVVPVTVNLVTGLVTSTTGLVGDTLNVVTGLTDGTVRTAVRTVDQTTRAVVNLAGDVTQATARTVDGVVQTTSNVVTQSVGAVETLTKRLADIEQSLAVAQPDGKLVKLPKTIADLPQKLAETEERIKQGVNERALADLTGRLQTLKQGLSGNGLAADDPEAARLQQQVAALQNDIGALTRSKGNRGGSGAAVAPDAVNALLTKVASVERDAAVAPFKRQVQTLSDSLREIKTRLGGDSGGAEGDRGSRKGRNKNGEVAVNDNFDLASELNKSLAPAAISTEPYSAEAAVRDLAARVKGTALGPKVNGVTMGGSPSSGTTGVASSANPVAGVVQGTQNTVTGVTNTTGNVVTGVVNTTQNIVGGVTNTTTLILKGLGGKK